MGADIVWLKIPQMPQNLSAQFVCPNLKIWDFNEKRPHWASVVCDSIHFRAINSAVNIDN